MICGGCGVAILGPLMDHYSSCPQFAPDRVKVRRLERKLAKARAARDQARRHLESIKLHCWSVFSSAYGERMQQLERERKHFRDLAFKAESLSPPNPQP